MVFTYCPFKMLIPGHVLMLAKKLPLSGDQGNNCQNKSGYFVPLGNP
jgi:hypothetical protein